MIEELVELFEKLDEPSDLCAVFCPWKKKEEILPLLIEIYKEKEKPLKLDIKPLPIELILRGGRPMPCGYFFIPKSLTGRQVAWNPQEVQTSHWMANLIFKGN